MAEFGVLFDLDGVVYQGDSLIPGAKKIINILRHKSIPMRFITNTTRMTKQNLLTKLESMGLTLKINEVFAAPHAAIDYCKAKGYNRIELVVPDKKMEVEFAEFDLNTKDPEAIIIGDMGELFTFNLLNGLFNKILHGAKIVALHKNKYWNSGKGLILDVGAFVSALEFASGESAVVLGKPKPLLFQLAVQTWGLPFQSIYMVGDDIDSDISGAKNVGMQSILVKTGKFHNKILEISDVKPDFLINSIADLSTLLKLS